jgi:CrcB protein
MWLKIILVAVGGALGALGRVGMGALAATLAGGPTVWGTVGANMLGCVGMGAGRGAVELYQWGTPAMRTLLFSGFLGAFTTFSTFEAEGIELWRSGGRGVSTLYFGGSLIGGVLAFFVGWTLVRVFAG